MSGNTTSANRAEPTVVAGLVLSAALLAGACGAENAAPNWAGEIQRLPGGAVVVANPEAGVWDEEMRWTVEETLRLGALDGDGPDVFGRIAALEVDTAGRIYAFDAQARELRVFGPDGRFLRRFGRRGPGPGEFQGVIGMSMAPDGALWLVDAQNTRYTVVRGQDFAVYRRRAALYNLPWLGGVTEAGVLYDAAVIPAESGSYEALLRVGSGGVITDTLRVARPELEVPGSPGMRFPLPYAPAVLRTFDRRGYVWLATSHEYRLVQMTPEGDTVRIVTRDLPPPALTNAQADSVRRYARRLDAEFGVDVEDSMVPRAAPLLKWFFVDDRAHLWVARATPDAMSSLDVFDGDGRFLGDVGLPFQHSSIPPIVRGERLYAVTTTELGVPQVVVCRISRSE